MCNYLFVNVLHSTHCGGLVVLFLGLALDGEVEPDGFDGRDEHQHCQPHPKLPALVHHDVVDKPPGEVKREEDGRYQKPLADFVLGFFWISSMVRRFGSKIVIIEQFDKVPQFLRLKHYDSVLSSMHWSTKFAKNALFINK